MGYLFDSSTLIDIERGDRHLDETSLTDPIGMSVVTLSEILHGAHRANSAALRARREAFADQLTRVLEVIPMDSSVAKVYAHIWADLASKGHSPGPHDLIIGATALARGWKIVTRNERHFKMIPDLEVVTW